MKKGQKKDYNKIKKELELEYSNSNPIPLSEFNKTSNELVDWYCKICKEDYPARIRKRVYDGSGCPVCGRKTSDIPLSKEFPHLLKDYDDAKNEKPLDFYSKGSDQKVWWKCHKCADERELPVRSRASRGYGCKICKSIEEVKKRNKRKIEIEGSLLERAPHIAAQWDFEKNSASPSEFTWKSGKKVHWVCEHGHTWKTSIHHRVKSNAGCRKCGNQNSQYEMRLFSELKIFDPEARWNERINGMECDIFLPSVNLAIEVDGYPWHDSDASRFRDLAKSKELLNLGIETIRYRDSQLKPLSSNEVFFKHNTDQFPTFIQLLKSILTVESSLPLKRKIEDYIKTKEGFVNEDEYNKLYLRSGKIIHRKSLQDEFPEIALFWSAKNSPLTPDDVYSRGKKIVWWICKTCGEDYPLRVGERTRKRKGNGNGCPCGSTKRVTFSKSLLGTRGEQVKAYWDFEANLLTPSDVRPASRKPVWWKFPCGHRFEEQVGKLWGDRRVKTVGCKVCGSRFSAE